MNRLLVSLALTLAACDASPPPQPQTEGPPNLVLETQIQAMKKARAVEGQMLDATEAQRKQMEEAAQ